MYCIRVHLPTYEQAHIRAPQHKPNISNAGWMRAKNIYMSLVQSFRMSNPISDMIRGKRATGPERRDAVTNP